MSGLINIDTKAVTEAVMGVVNRVWPDKTAQEKEALDRELQRDLGQLEVNKAEAANPSLFIAGWRPFVGWVCGAALAWQYVAGPLLVWALSAWEIKTTLPALDMVGLMGILTTLLGMGSLRTVEKYTGTEGNR